MFVPEPGIPPTTTGLPTAVVKEIKLLEKQRDDFVMAGEAQSLAYHNLQAKPFVSRSQTAADGVTLSEALIDLKLRCKSLCSKSNTFAFGAYEKAMRELHYDAVNRAIAAEKTVLESLLAMGFGADPDQRGGYPPDGPLRHESVRSAKERIDEIGALIDTSRRIARTNAEIIERIDTELAKHKARLLSA